MTAYETVESDIVERLHAYVGGPDNVCRIGTADEERHTPCAYGYAVMLDALGRPARTLTRLGVLPDTIWTLDAKMREVAWEIQHPTAALHLATSYAEPPEPVQAYQRQPFAAQLVDEHGIYTIALAYYRRRPDA